VRNFGMRSKLITAMCLASVGAIGAFAQGQPDSQAGAQLGEQSALGGKQGQGANTEKTETSASGETTFAAGTIISAELTSALDSKKVKQGDIVNAKITNALKSTDGRTILPAGAKVAGRVTQASARGAGQPDSTLGLVFEKATLKNGQQISFTAAVQAVGAPVSSVTSNSGAADVAPMESGNGTMAGGGGTAGRSNTSNAGMEGTRSNVPAVTDPVDGTNGAAGTPTGPGDGTGSSRGDWNSNSHGVIGLGHLSLSAAGGSNPQGSVIASTGKNVHLDSGTRLILVTQAPPTK
jgi:hypothetical protein